MQWITPSEKDAATEFLESRRPISCQLWPEVPKTLRVGAWPHLTTLRRIQVFDSMWQTTENRCIVGTRSARERTCHVSYREINFEN